MTFPAQKDVLAVRDGNIRLVENDAQTKFQVRKLKHLLPVHPTKSTEFDQNKQFARAKRRGKPFIAFQWAPDSSNCIIIIVAPTRPVASIRAFAKQAPLSEWMQFWTYAFHVQKSLQDRYGGYFYMDTELSNPRSPMVPQFHVRLTRRPDVVYRLKFAPNVAAVDRGIMVQNANDPQGWCGRFKCVIEETQQSPTVHVQFASPADLRAQFGPTFDQLSVSVLQPSRAPIIYFNRLNWNRVPPGFRGTLSMYRNYLVQHELGHALFHVWTHDSEPASGVCPVMMQQTKGTSTCTPGIHHHPHEWTVAHNKDTAEWLASL